MPVKIPDGLPAAAILEAENILIMPESLAFTQNIRPAQIAIVNIMPNKCATETRLLRLLSGSPLQVAVRFLHPRSHACRNTPAEHLARFYSSFEEVRDLRFDCLIITGAPVETIPFEEVNYWNELQELMDWSRSNVHSTLHLCWGAQAGLYHHYGIAKHLLPQKLSGVFAHTITEPQHPLQHGFDDEFFAPHSRYTGIRNEDIERVGALRILSASPEAGAYIIADKDARRIFITGHPEYGRLTLKEEYDRDLAKGLPVPVPANYFPGDDPALLPAARWQCHASLLFMNWLNMVYQGTSFDPHDQEPTG